MKKLIASLVVLTSLNVVSCTRIQEKATKFMADGIFYHRGHIAKFEIITTPATASEPANTFVVVTKQDENGSLLSGDPYKCVVSPYGDSMQCNRGEWYFHFIDGVWLESNPPFFGLYATYFPDATGVSIHDVPRIDLADHKPSKQLLYLDHRITSDEDRKNFLRQQLSEGNFIEQDVLAKYGVDYNAVHYCISLLQNSGLLKHRHFSKYTFGEGNAFMNNGSLHYRRGPKDLYCRAPIQVKQ